MFLKPAFLLSPVPGHLVPQLLLSEIGQVIYISTTQTAGQDGMAVPSLAIIPPLQLWVLKS